MTLLIKAHIFVTKDQVAKHLDCNRVKIFPPYLYSQVYNQNCPESQCVSLNIPINIKNKFVSQTLILPEMHST